MTIGDALAAAAEQWPDEVGWVFEDRHITRSDANHAVDHVATAFVGWGVEPGDRVAVWLSNRVEWALAFFACARIGAILVALNTRWKAPEAGYVLEHSRPKLLVLQRRFLNIDFGTLLDELGYRQGRGPAADLLVIEVGGTELPGTEPFPTPPGSSATSGVGHTGAAAAARAVRPDDPVLLQYTSGSTGRPKGALVPHRMALNYGVEIVQRLGIRADEAYLSPQPLYHVAGSCAGLPLPLTLPIRVVVPEYYDVERVLRLTERERCVARGGTSTMYLDELAHDRFTAFDTRSLRAGWVGAPPAVLDRIRAEYPIPDLVNLYAASEGGGTCGVHDEPWERRRITVGRPLSGTEVHIRDPETGRDVPVGAVGEIGFRGWNKMLGYHRDPVSTAAALDEAGFLHLGDLGRLDDEGHLHFIGRLKDMIRVGGENVAAEEVEHMLTRHPTVRQAAVIGRPDPRLGEVVVAVVEPVPGARIDTDALVDYCRQRLASFRVPRAVHIVEEWPLTASGKIHKPSLRDRYGAHATEPDHHG